MKVSLLIIGIGVGVLLIVLPLPTNQLPVLDTNIPDPESEALIIFGGDMMFDRYIRQVMTTVGGEYVFSCIAHILIDSDAVVANLEGPITDFPSQSIGTKDGDFGHYSFTFPPEVAHLLARHNIFIVNIGNNHTFDFGEEGVQQTKEYLTRADVAYVDKDEPLEIELNGVPFTFITHNQFSPLNSDIIYDITVGAIEEAKMKGRVPVVYAHWGEEYAPVTTTQRAVAHRYIDAGAALVVGSHPHIVQEVERYKEKYIYYSLGNFIFDQYFSDTVRSGLLLSVTFNKEGVKSIQEISITLHPDGRVCVSDPVER